MPVLKKRVNFFESKEGMAIKQLLRDMASDSTYNTDPSFTTNGELYPNHLMPFVDKHMNYISTHPALDARQYVSNLRLRTRIR